MGCVKSMTLPSENETGFRTRERNTKPRHFRIPKSTHFQNVGTRGAEVVELSSVSYLLTSGSILCAPSRVRYCSARRLRDLSEAEDDERKMASLDIGV